METKTGSIDEKAIFYVLECNFHLGELATASVRWVLGHACLIDLCSSKIDSDRLPRRQIQDLPCRRIWPSMHLDTTS
jgi:hypothetical protein